MAIKGKGNGKASGKGNGGGEYDETNRIAIFPNSRKVAGDTRPDYTGRVNVDGEERWISLWKRKSAKGVLYLSGAVNDPVEEQETPAKKGKQQSVSQEEDDPI